METRYRCSELLTLCKSTLGIDTGTLEAEPSVLLSVRGFLVTVVQESENRGTYIIKGIVTIVVHHYNNI